MSTVSKALRTEETETNEGRTIAGIVNSIETLEGGGFLVRFVTAPTGDSEVLAGLQAIPGATPLAAANEWSVPADPAAASALLQFAKRYEFDFIPTKTNHKEELLSDR